jgi:hypothetical protein
MNKVIILAAFIFGMSHTSEAQLRTNSNTTTTKVVTEDDKQKLTAHKSLLEALDTKEAWIRSNPEEFKIATKNGWFIDADKTRKELNAKIAVTENKTK